MHVRVTLQTISGVEVGKATSSRTRYRRRDRLEQRVAKERPDASCLPHKFSVLEMRLATARANRSASGAVYPPARKASAICSIESWPKSFPTQRTSVRGIASTTRLIRVHRM